MKQLLVTAAVIYQEGRFLMAKRRDGDREGGKWEFPGGKVELGEDPRVGLERELDEELGIKVEVGPVIEVVSETQNELQIILIYLGCRIMAGRPEPLECQQVSWLRPEEIEQLELPALDRRFWEGFHRNFR